jgi:hypothetical protein
MFHCIIFIESSAWGGLHVNALGEVLVLAEADKVLPGSRSSVAGGLERLLSSSAAVPTAACAALKKMLTSSLLHP